MKKIIATTLAALFVLALMLGVAACGGSSSDSGGGSGTVTVSGQATTVNIRNLSFNPPVIAVRTGTTVTWSNGDTLTHTVTASNGAFDSGRLEPGKNFGYTFNSAGTYDYACTIHPTMKGQVMVSGPGT
ncbi:MAG: cupredoxin domain-containing protein [Thermoleophilia bacterium]